VPVNISQRLRSVSPAQAAATVAVLAFLLYLPSLAFDFLNWDDDGYVTTNQALAYPWRDFLEWAFTTFRQGNWHPLTWLSLKIDHSLWGMNPAGYHLTNAALHAVNALLVVALMWRLSADEGGARSAAVRLGFAFIVGLVFAVHPLHVESVAWVSERKDLLCALFYLSSLIAWLAWTRAGAPGGAGPYGLSLLFFILALLSKPMAVSLPVILVLLDIYPLQRQPWKGRIVVEKIPFFAVAAASCVVTVIAQSSAESVAPMVDLSLADRFANAGRALFFYLGKSLWPADLSPLYQLRVVEGGMMLRGAVAGVAVLALFAWAIFRVRKSPLLFVLLAAFTAMLLPVLGIVQVGSQFAADRYMYLPMVPLAVGACMLAWRLRRNAGLPAAWLAAFVAVVTLLMGFLSYQQMQHWRNSEALWKKVLAEDAEIPTAHYNLGNHYLAENRLELAETEWLAVVRLDPGHSMAHNQLGNLSFLRGELKSALENYREAVENDSENIEAVFNYARVLDQLGMIHQAREFYRRFVELATAEYRTQVELASNRISQIDAIDPP